MFSKVLSYNSSRYSSREFFFLAIMSGWFQRSPDPRQRSLQSSNRVIVHHRDITPSIPSVKKLSQDGSAATTEGKDGCHSPLAATKSTPVILSPSIPSIPEIKVQASSSSTEMVELQKELSRLQEREHSLSHKLALEREQRVRAEQLVEVERLAFHELKYRLHLEEKKHSYDRVEEEKDGGDGGKDFIDGGVNFTDADISEGLDVSCSYVPSGGCEV